jgi:hypothetical protein
MSIRFVTADPSMAAMILNWPSRFMQRRNPDENPGIRQWSA